MNENVLREIRGHKETFVVNIQFQDNATWQGSIVWTRTGQEAHFRSVLEMIKLMDDALKTEQETE